MAGGRVGRFIPRLIPSSHYHAQGHEDSPTAPSSSSIPPPLNIPPSRARRQLAARLAQRKKEAEAVELDPDAADHAALETASQLPEEPNEIDLGPAAERELREAGLQITGLRGLSTGAKSGASKFSGLFSSSGSNSSSGSADSSSSNDEEDAAKGTLSHEQAGEAEEDEGSAEPGSSGIGRRLSQKEKDERKQRRPSTTEAKVRSPLDEDEDGDLGRAMDSKMVLGEGPFADPDEMEDESSDEDELVEIRPRRTS